jgi:hypothetical protein
MPRYYLHLRDGTDELIDEEGCDYPDMETLRKKVLMSARDVMGNELKSGGVVDLRCRIDAENESGEIIYTLPFKHALNIIPESQA